MGGTFEELRRRHVAARDAALPGYAACLAWTAEAIATERERALRQLLEAAKTRSPWHRERLRGAIASGKLRRFVPLSGAG